MIKTTEPRSAGWWMLRLARKLEYRQKRLNVLNDRFEGNPPLPEGAENVKNAYRAFQRKARTNFAELLVEATRERMLPTGFRTAAAGDDNGDAAAAAIWEANGLQVESADVHTHMLTMGDGYTIVGPPDDDAGQPVITSEDPRQVVTVHDPVRQRLVRAGFKLFHDDDEDRDFAYLYLPGKVYVASREARRSPRTKPSVRFSPSSWDWDDDRGGIDGQDLDHDVVPVVRFRNRRGVGEFEPHVDVLDRINHQILQRMVIATMQAFRQRAIKNAPTHDEQGNEIDYDELLAADPGAVWTLPEGIEMWESGQVDLTPILMAVKDDIRDLAAVTRTPLASLMPGGENQTAEGAAFAREGLVFKTEDRIARAAEGWKDTMTLAFLFAGDTERADRSKLEVLWAPADRKSLAEKADAESKATAGIPWRTRMVEIWGFTPAQVDRMESERAADVLLNPPAPPAGVGAGG